DRVPARRTLLHLLDALWLLKFNQFQLYVEHSFAFAGHETVWSEASPLRDDDILWLDDQCAMRGIELVANLNSLGHFGRWLKHPEYRHLSECPEGITLPNGRVMPAGGTTLAPCAETLAFIDSIYAQYLPLFKSHSFNAGLDEPWELGLGRSAALCNERGKQSVYLEQLRNVAALAEKYGKRLQFWADIVLEAPERVCELPEAVTGMIWGYEAGHPFEEQCGAFERACVPFVVCPGTTGWHSLAGRWQNARANIREAVLSAKRHGGIGVLLTDWGDDGHHQPPVVSLPPLAHCAQLAWNGAETSEEELAQALDSLILRDSAGVCGKALLALGSLSERHFSRKIHNCVPVWKMLFAANAELARLLPEEDRTNIPAFRAELAAIAASIAKATPKGFGGALAREELELAARMLQAALDRFEGRLSDEQNDAVCGQFEELWLRRSERGGLSDSLSRLKNHRIEP
ncbi:MAG: family 20 glycosylhydrolase, partial [Opitutales bacterium]|nr:family 20 glycosylhydrolase [Opitutales bacterium]